MKDVKEFLGKYKFALDDIDIDALLKEFGRQMDAGLAGGKSSLAMIPAFTAIDKPIPANTPTLVLDAGGTNLRAAVVWFDDSGKPRIEDFHKYPMPGTEGRELTAEQFFDRLATVLIPIAERAGTIGFCFSYPAEITPEHDGILIRWSKQVSAKEVIGKPVGAELVAAFEKKTGRKLAISLLNDTVATLLAGRSAGMSRQYSSFVGFILGTGTNTAYIEKHSRIKKLPGLDPNGLMTVNEESGYFDGFAPSDFDKAMDAPLPDCGSSLFEKMISGAYLGKVGLAVLQAAAREGFFSQAAADGILSLKDLANKDFDDFTSNPFIKGTAFDAIPLADDDRRAIMAVAAPVFLRAAKLTAVNIAAAVLRSGEGRDPLHPVCVTVDGSTYYKTRSVEFKSRIEEHLRDILAPRGVHYELICVNDAPIVGAAVAGLTM